MGYAIRLYENKNKMSTGGLLAQIKSLNMEIR